MQFPLFACSVIVQQVEIVLRSPVQQERMFHISHLKVVVQIKYVDFHHLLFIY